MTGKYDAIMATAFTAAPVTTIDAFDPTTGTTFDLRGYKEKVLMIVNTGSNGLTWNLLGSIDDGVTFDIQVLPNSNVAAGTTTLPYRDSNYVTHWLVQMQSETSGNPTTAFAKFAAIGD